jgi:hypothetical protein
VIYSEILNNPFIEKTRWNFLILYINNT